MARVGLHPGSFVEPGRVDADRLQAAAVVVFVASAIAAMVAQTGVAPGNEAWRLLLLAPVLEEAVFRTGLQACLMRWLPGLPLSTNLATAGAFAVGHMLARGFWPGVAVFPVALLLGWVYGRTRSLTLCIALHALANAVWFFLILPRLLHAG